MSLNPTSLAAVTGATVQNKTFSTGARNVPRKILLIGSYDPAKTLVIDDIAIQIFSAADAGDQFGFGSMLHRMAIAAFIGGQGVPVFVVPQTEAGTAAEGTITLVPTTVEAGVLSLYIAGVSVPVTVVAGDDATAIGDAVTAAITANADLPVDAANTAGVVTFTAKSISTYGNEITIRFNIKAGDIYPANLPAPVIVAMASGAGTPDITTALNGLGTGDNANGAFYTDVVHGYLQDTTTLDAISAYVGSGNDFVGLYAKTVGRPFRVLTGDTVALFAGLTALLAISVARKLDRANGIIAAPGSANHPTDIACQAMGVMARTNQSIAAQSYEHLVLTGVDPGAEADWWTSDYTNRDNAVKGGISPTFVENEALTLQNVVSFYRPDNVPVESNGYRSMRNISIIQNLIDAVRVAFSGEGYQGYSIVEDSSLVNAPDSSKVKDVNDVRNTLTALAFAFEGKGWIFGADFTIGELAKENAITIRSGGTGFDNILSVQLSGVGGITDTVIQFDTSIVTV